MIELKVDPRKDALVGPAMQRRAVEIQRILAAYKAKRIDLESMKEQLETALTDALVLAVARGYSLAITTTKVSRSPADEASLLRIARARAKTAAKHITKTTKKALSVEASVSKKTVASKERAQGIVEYEVPRMMFIGMRKGWGRVTGTRMPTKRWITVNDNSCEDCQMNEDDGPIPVDDTFSSGDDEPPKHNNCECILGLYL